MFFKCFQAYTTKIIFVSVFVCGEEKEIKQLKWILKKGSFVVPAAACQQIVFEI